MKQMSTAAWFGLFLAICSASAPARGDAPRFAWLSVAPEVGWQFFGTSTLENDFGATVKARNGVVLKAHVDIGGDRFALELAPLYAWQGTSGMTGNLSAFGGEATLAYRFSSGAMYPGIGVGFHGAYLFPTDSVARGLELAARIPVGLTWYFFKYLGLVVESGFMIGTVGIRFKDGAADPIAQALSGRTEYALSLGCDIVIGLRFP